MLGLRLKDRWQKKINGYFGPVPKPTKWLFIVGCYNSGTTLLHDILAHHPEIGSMPKEGQYYTDQLTLPKDVGLARLWALQPELFYLDENSDQKINVGVLKRQWGANLQGLERPVLMEKSPTNVARVRWLQKHFENAYFVGIVRNGYAVAEGIRRKQGHELEAAAHQWARSNDILLRDFDYLENKMIISYEALTERSTEVLTSILQFVELDSSIVGRLASREWQIQEKSAQIQNMNLASFERLTVDDRLLIEQIAGQLLAQLKYKGV